MKLASRRFLLGVIVLFAVGSAGGWAADESSRNVTYFKDVLPILQENCQTCHRPFGANLSGMIAPMPLMTYAEVRPWAKAIAQTVVGKVMPPWHVAPELHGIFKQELTLTEQEIKTIARWVQTGANRGDVADAPEPRDWPETGWSIGDPDIIMTFAEPYWVADEVDDQYKTIVVELTEERMPEPRWLKSIEFKPGSGAVHHIIAYTGAIEGAAEGEFTASMLGGEAPGTDPSRHPDGYGILVPKGPLNITFDMHYHKEKGPGTGVWDSSSFAMKFHEKDEPVTHPIQITTVAHGAFEIPPGHPNWKVSGARTFEKDTTILAFLPHLHLRGVAAKYTAYYGDGTEEVLLDVPRYDFNWQRWFEFKELKEIPAGTRVEFEIIYDNSDQRAAEIGFNSSRPVRFGGPTWDEMDLGWVIYADTAPTDNALQIAIERGSRSRRGGRGSALGKTARLTLSGKDVRITYGSLSTDSEDYKRFAAAQEGDVFSYTGSRATKLITEADLRFGDTVIKAGNAAEGYAGVYSLWLKKVGDGWHLVFNSEADIWGTRHDPAADVAEVPLTLARTDEDQDRFLTELEEEGKGGILRFAWGSEQWTARFSLVREIAASSGAGG